MKYYYTSSFLLEPPKPKKAIFMQRRNLSFFGCSKKKADKVAKPSPLQSHTLLLYYVK